MGTFVALDFGMDTVTFAAAAAAHGTRLGGYKSCNFFDLRTVASLWSSSRA